MSKRDQQLVLKQRVLAYARVRPPIQKPLICSSSSSGEDLEEDSASCCDGQTATNERGGLFSSLFNRRGRQHHQQQQKEQRANQQQKDESMKKMSMCTRASESDPRIVETAKGEYRLDHAFGEKSSQRDVWDAIGEPALVDVMKGTTACVLAYGQTGAGKTYALLNLPGVETKSSATISVANAFDEEEEEAEEERKNSAGLVPRLAVELFGKIEREKKKDRRMKHIVQISMMQIYNEVVDDLLEDLDKNSSSINAADSRITAKKQKNRTKNVVKRRSNNESNNKTQEEMWEVDDLTWIQCDSASMLLQKFAEGRKRLRYAETRMNKHSSRSHCVLHVKVTKRKEKKRRKQAWPAPEKGVEEEDDDEEVSLSTANNAIHSGDEDNMQNVKRKNTLTVEQTEGVLTVVDLAGSERQHKDYASSGENCNNNKKDKAAFRNNASSLVTSVKNNYAINEHEELRFKEATRINQSLLALGNCVRALASNAAHVPIRDSNLTKILCSSLNGRTRTFLLVCVSSEAEHASETAAALEFATNAMRVETLASCSKKVIIEMDESDMLSENRKSSSSTSSSTADDNQDDGDSSSSGYDDNLNNVRYDDQENDRLRKIQQQRPFSTVREGKLRREIQSLRDELEAAKIERVVAEQRAKENDERKEKEIEAVKARINNEQSDLFNNLKALQRENREKSEQMESLQREKNVLLAKYREKIRDFDSAREKSLSLINHEVRLRKIAESTAEREQIQHIETRKKLDRERLKGEKTVSKCAYERVKMDNDHQCRVMNLNKQLEIVKKKAYIELKTMDLYYARVKRAAIVIILSANEKKKREEEASKKFRALAIQKRKDAQIALRFRALRDDYQRTNREKDKTIDNEKRRLQRARLHAVETKEKLKIVSKNFNDFRLRIRDELDQQVQKGLVLHKQTNGKTYERVARVVISTKKKNERVLQQGFVKWSKKKTIAFDKIEKVAKRDGLENTQFVLKNIKRNLRSQFAPYSFDDDEYCNEHNLLQRT